VSVRTMHEHVFVRPKGAIGETRAQVAALRSRGLTLAEIARELGVSKPTVSYHARKLGIPAEEKFTCRYDWEELQRFYDAGHSITACQRRFGFARATFVDAAKRGEIRREYSAWAVAGFFDHVVLADLLTVHPKP
jgi:DNA invertase Pin-like site-specific DNA recombinase